jgi:predicted RNase H-like HicB family nuclease
MSEIVFNVKPDVTGGYCASAFEQSIFTQGETFEELLANIREAVELYAEGSGQPPEVITLRLHGLVPLAA